MCITINFYRPIVAKAIIEEHGGTMGMFSEGEGCGSTFFFELPLFEGRSLFGGTGNHADEEDDEEEMEDILESIAEAEEEARREASERKDEVDEVMDEQLFFEEGIGVVPLLGGEECLINLLFCCCCCYVECALLYMTITLKTSEIDYLFLSFMSTKHDCSHCSSVSLLLAPL
jgi:hypothetical protein